MKIRESITAIVHTLMLVLLVLNFVISLLPKTSDTHTQEFLNHLIAIRGILEEVKK